MRHETYSRTVYICPICGRESTDLYKIKQCQGFHMGLTSPMELEEYDKLKLAVEKAGYKNSTSNNAETRKAYDDAIQALRDFEQEHNVNPNPTPGTMTPSEILNRWAVYSKFDPNQTRFNLMSDEYTFHRCNEQLVKFMEYDPTGAIGVLYARSVFEKALDDKRVNLMNIVKQPDIIRDEIEMWKIFNSPSIQTIQQELLDRINQLVIQITSNKMIGERDIEAERNALLQSVDAIVEQLSTCKVELFLKGGPIQPIKSYSTHIHVFERLADCLLALEQASDGMYLCYIDNMGTADGYFGFFIKSNGSILAIDERVDEAYPGQHKNSRNGRWSESKKFQLFPYDHIFSFSDYDYKGYAGKHMIDHDKLAFFNLSPGAYMPLILAMILLNNKYTGFDVSNMPIKYLDSLLSINVNLPAPGITALTIPEKSAIAAIHRNLTLDIDTDSVLTGSYAQRFKDKTRDYRERGDFDTEPNLFVQLYGEGFHLQPDILLESNRHLRALPGPGDLESDMDRTPNCEFVGTEKRMEVIAYMNARLQLAEYIRDQMLAEYLRFGGRRGVTDWFNHLMQTQKDRFFELCVQKVSGITAGSEHNVTSLDYIDTQESPLRYITMLENCKGSPDGFGWSTPRKFPFNKPHSRDRYGRIDNKWLCPITGNMVSIFFVFRFINWHELADCFGNDNIPKCVQGWQRQRTVSGNPLLNATDPVENIGTVFEDDEIRKNKRLWTAQKWEQYFHRDWTNREAEVPDTALPESSEFCFDFAIGFSKRGYAMLSKQVLAKEAAEKESDKGGQ